MLFCKKENCLTSLCDRVKRISPSKIPQNMFDKKHTLNGLWIDQYLDKIWVETFPGKIYQLTRPKTLAPWVVHCGALWIVDWKGGRDSRSTGTGSFDNDPVQQLWTVWTSWLGSIVDNSTCISESVFRIWFRHTKIKPVPWASLYSTNLKMMCVPAQET